MNLKQNYLIQLIEFMGISPTGYYTFIGIPVNRKIGNCLTNGYCFGVEVQEIRNSLRIWISFMQKIYFVEGC